MTTSNLHFHFNNHNWKSWWITVAMIIALLLISVYSSHAQVESCLNSCTYKSELYNNDSNTLYVDYVPSKESMSCYKITIAYNTNKADTNNIKFKLLYYKFRYLSLVETLLDGIYMNIGNNKWIDTVDFSIVEIVKHRRYFTVRL